MDKISSSLLLCAALLAANGVPNASAQGTTITCEPTEFVNGGTGQYLVNTCSDSTTYGVQYDYYSNAVNWWGSSGWGQIFVTPEGPPTLPQGVPSISEYSEKDGGNNLQAFPIIGAIVLWSITTGACYGNSHSTIAHLGRQCAGKGGVSTMSTGVCGMGARVTCHN